MRITDRTRLITTKPLPPMAKERLLTLEGVSSCELLQDMPLTCTQFYSNFTTRDIFQLNKLNPLIGAVDSKGAKINFLHSEISNLVSGFEHVFDRTQLVNPLSRVIIAGSKPLQLLIASQLRLRTPRTLITSSVIEARKFLASVGGRFIIKTIDTSVAHNPRDAADPLFIFTQEITMGQLQNDYATSFGAPVIIQQLIEKRYELRICVFGSFVHVVKIDSQQYDSSSLDWRWRQADASLYSYTSVADTYVQQLLAYLGSLGLDSGVFDIAVDGNNELVFFECNPSGQWGAMDACLGSEIAIDYANYIGRRIHDLS